MASPHAFRPAKPDWAGPGALATAGLFLAAALAAYFPALRGGFLWDDDAHVTGLPLRSLHGLWRIWFEVGATQQYYPVLHSAFWVEHRIWGDSVLGYHLTNVALHVAAALLLVAILRRLSFPAATLAGLVFLLHPVCVESVAWISEQKNTLSAVFYLGSALLYLRFDETRGRGPYFAALVLFVLALLTKSVTATLPAALLVIFWWQGRLSCKREVLPLLPWFVIGAASGLFTAWTEAKLIGAEGAGFSMTALQRLLLAGRVVLFYLGKLLWPADLTFIYPRWTVDPAQASQWLFLGGALALFAALVFQARRARGPLASFLFFAGSLFPVLGFVNVYPFLFSFVADHFQYLASIGVIVPAAWVLSVASMRLGVGTAARASLMLAVPALLGVLTFRQCGMYRDAESLYRTTIMRNPSAWLMHYNLAVTLENRPDRFPEAVAEYEETLRLKPDHWAAHNNLGSAYLRMSGRSADAAAQFEEAIRINPSFAEAQNNLGVALGRGPGNHVEAVAHLRTAIRLRPEYDGAHENLGVQLMGEPRSLDEAIMELRLALRLAPENPEYHYNLANALLLQAGQGPGAVAEYREALRLRPGYAEAHSNLGAALAREPGHLPEAVSEYEAALRLVPSNAAVHVNLAHALARLPGRGADAVSEYHAALTLDPSDAETHLGLGVLLADMPGRLGDALPELEAAVSLEPGSAKAQYCLGFGLAKAGHRDEAARHLERALEIDPGFKLAKDALARIKATP